MPHLPSRIYGLVTTGLLVLAASISSVSAAAQGGGGGNRTPRGDSLRQAQRLDSEGRHDEARRLFQVLIDNAADPAAKAAAQRRMAMSYGFTGDCANTVKCEEMVIGLLENARAGRATERVPPAG